MSAHTPGPWFVDERDSAESMGLNVAHNPKNSDMWHKVLHVPMFYAKDVALVEECWANARLVAAAPDLYAACKAALAAMDSVHNLEGTDVWGNERAQLSAAIAKAEPTK